MKTEMDFDYYFRFKKDNTNFNCLWEMKSANREFIDEWIRSNLGVCAKHEEIATSCSELIENAIKYSLDKEYSSFSIVIKGDYTFISVANNCSLENKERLKSVIKEIVDNRSRLNDFYVTKLISLSREPEKSELGLLRIVMDTEGDLSVEEDESGRITVILKIKTQKEVAC